MRQDALTLHGLLLAEGSQVRLDVGNGAYWYVECDRRDLQILRQGVTVTGQRVGFNTIDAESMKTG